MRVVPCCHHYRLVRLIVFQFPSLAPIRVGFAVGLHSFCFIAQDLALMQTPIAEFRQLLAEVGGRDTAREKELEKVSA